MAFFFSSEITLNEKLLEILFIIMGCMCFYVAKKHLMNWLHVTSRETFLFWSLLGTVLAFGRFIPDSVVGVLILLMTLPAILKKVIPLDQLTTKTKAKTINEQGMKIFIPAVTMGIVAIFCSLFTDISALVGIGIGVGIALIILSVYSRKNTLPVFLENGTEMLEIVGPLAILPMLLASLGAVYTQAGVGDVMTVAFEKIIPEGNILVGLLVLSFGMVLFTMVMGNSFASITVMLVGVGYPFVLNYGVDPVIGMIILSCGSCGTLLTPMAANFNIVPVTILEMKNRYGVIKNQVVVALIVLVFQIFYLYYLSL